MAVAETAVKAGNSILAGVKEKGRV